MKKLDLNCQKCNSKIEVGFILDDAVIKLPLRWIKGKPDKSLYGKMWGVKTMFKNKLYIEAHRCTSCGFLELFANEDYSLLNKK